MDKIVEFKVLRNHLVAEWERHPKDVREALECSIKKWETIVDESENRLFDERKIKIEDGGTRTCALCLMFNTIDQGDCIGCPIEEHIGLGECIRTPYDDYYDTENNKDALVAAIREVKFLKSLRNKFKNDIGEEI